MKKSKIRFLVPLIVTVIPSISLSIYLFLFAFAGRDDKSIEYKITFFATAFLSIAILISLILIWKFDVNFFRTFIRTIPTGVLLLVGGVILGAWFIEVIIVFAIIYPIFCILIIANRVRLTLKKQNKSQVDKPKLSHILAITIINPLLTLLPLLMLVLYEFTGFDFGFV